jgi:hypothetical protein
MAKQRMVNEKFWSDSYIIKLSMTERFLFLYFLTNEHTNIAGIYEIPLRVMIFESGMKEKDILKIMSKLENDGKIVYKENWIYIINFIKNQNLNPSVIIGIKRVLNEIPSSIHTALGTGWGQAGGRLSELNLTKLNLTEPLKNENLSLKEKKYEFVKIDFKCDYSQAGNTYGKYKLFMGEDKKIYGKCSENKQYILLSEIKKTY